MDAGLATLTRIFERLLIDEAWTVRRPRGFTWVAHRLAQSVDATAPFDSLGVMISPVTVRVPVVQGVQAPQEDVELLLGRMNADAVGCALIYWPEERRIESFLGHAVHDEILDYRAEQLAAVAILQLCNTEAGADWLAEKVGGNVAQWAHPKGGRRADRDDMLNVADHVFIPRGDGPSRYADGTEIDAVLALIQGSGYASLGGSAGGVSIEAPFGEGETSLIRLRTGEVHPWLGAGLLVTTSLPMHFSASKLTRIAGRLNRDQVGALDQVGGIGAWSLRPEHGGREFVTWTRFLPNALYRPGGAKDAALPELIRARWVDGLFFPGLPERNAWPILSRRFGKVQGDRPVGDIKKVDRDVSAWKASSGTVLMTWSIFNPNGPTINCIGLRDMIRDNTREVFYRCLHFLSDRTLQLGILDVSGTEWWPELVRILERAFAVDADQIGEDSPLVSSVPSLVTHGFPGGHAELAPDLLRIAREVQRADWGREMYFLRKYGSRLFDRAGEELREAMQDLAREHPPGEAPEGEIAALARAAYGRVPTFTDMTPIDHESRPFESSLFAEWWATVSDPEFTGLGLGQLAAAWVGAIHLVRGSLPAVVQFEDVRDFLAAFGHALWPDDLTTPSLRSVLGLE